MLKVLGKLVGAAVTVAAGVFALEKLGVVKYNPNWVEECPCPVVKDLASQCPVCSGSAEKTTAEA
ncbi:hypothetical protein QJ043_01215 [Olsenella sp. YH-ols2217]|uniref:Uncharacterized protein n=1 Tax=Kribbibacterium absianum TaxID=3044210 RepID=A0ABT6ZI21_9ACTN|nr:hypothetical protein [Olsenella sp. YH-ols2217]MDJ1128707.1 hypothetical protein [Olsenella sp. YH-ols2217]